MSESQTSFPRAAHRAALPPTLLLASVGLALFLSSMWTARADASGVSTEVVYATRFVSLATYLLMAWCFRNRLPQADLTVGIGSSFMLVHLAAVVGTPFLALPQSISTIVDYLSGIFEGVANALITLVFAFVFSSFVPRKSAPAIGVAYLLVDVGILVLDTMSTPVIHYARPAFTLVAVAIAFYCSRRLFVAGGKACPADRRLYEAALGDARPAWGKPGFLSARNDWFLLLIVAFLFPTLFGVIAQVSSETGGNFALYDIPTEIVMIAMQALFLLYMVFYGTTYGFAAILAFIIPLFATGFALFPSNWASGNPFAGCLIRAGFVILAVLLWALMARKSYDDPVHVCLFFGVYCGISNGQVGRLTGTLLMGDAGPSLALCQNISLAALWAICIFGLLLFFLLRRAGQGQNMQPAGDGFAMSGEVAGGSGTVRSSNGSLAGGGSVGPAGPVNATAAFAARSVAASGIYATGDAQDAASVVPASDGMPVVLSAQPASPADFFVRFEALSARIRLTQREHEVLLEALHGYSRTNIAKKLCLSPETVKTYLNRAYAKAGVTSKQELVALVEDTRE